MDGDWNRFEDGQPATGRRWVTETAPGVTEYAAEVRFREAGVVDMRMGTICFVREDSGHLRCWLPEVNFV